ncbi:MAG: hypothetical protein AB1425_10420 [Actinomycetota bacterium]
MRPTADYVHPFRVPSGVRSACRVRLYVPDEEDGDLGDAPVTIISEPPNNPGTSVTNAIEQLAAEVIDAQDLVRVPVFIEHYPPGATGGREETFDLVVFSHHEVREVLCGRVWGKEIGPPTRKPLGRRAVEVLVGSPV